MKKPYRINLDLYGCGQDYQNYIQYVQYDNNAYPLIVQLKKNGRPFRIPSGAAFEFNFELPSGMRACRIGRTAPSSAVAYDINYEDLSEFGEYTGSVSLKLHDGTRLTWPEFTFYVRRSLSDGVRPVVQFVYRTVDMKIYRCSDGKILRVRKEAA